MTLYNYKLTYFGKGNESIGYADASLGRYNPKGKPVTGQVIQVFGNSIDWGTMRQNLVATSTMKTEYIVLNKMVKDLMFLTKICSLMTNEPIKPIVYKDNQATIQAVETGNSNALKH